MAEAESTPQIYTDADFYDWLARFTAPDDLPFYRWLRQGNPGALLELGCGTGRVCLALAADGAEVAGIDRSLPLLQRARDKARGLAVPPLLVQADLREFGLDRAFDLLLLPYNTLNHLHGIDDLARALACFRRHMHADSLLVIDTFNPDLRSLDADPAKEMLLVRFPAPDGRWLSLRERARYDAVGQIYTSDWRYCDGDEHQVATDRIAMRVYFPQELDAVLRLQGLRIQAKYGDYDRSEFAADSPKQLLLCRLA